MTILVFILIFSALLTGLFLLFITRNNGYWKHHNVPYIRPTPIFGNALDVVVGKKLIGMFLKDIYNKCSGSLIGFFILDQPCLLIKDQKLVKHVLVTDSEYFPNRAATPDVEYRKRGCNTLFLSQVPSWYDDRRPVNLLFTPGKIKKQLHSLEAGGHQMVSAIQEMISKNGTNINVKYISVRYTINSITSCLLGVRGNIFEEKDSPFMWLTQRVLNSRRIWYAFQAIYTFIAPQLSKLFGMQMIDDLSANFFQDFTTKIMQEHQKTGGRDSDLIDILLDIKKKGYSKAENFFAARVSETFVAGFDTTSTALSLCLYQLAKHPEYQALARKEVQNIAEQSNCFSYDGLQYLVYLKNCLLETLRLYPPVMFLDRRTTKKYTVPDSDLVLEKGQAVYVPTIGIHYDAEYYPDPELFKPDRFTGKNVEQRLDFTFLAFGYGPRVCPGKRFAILSSLNFLANILLNFDVRLPEGIQSEVELQKQGLVLQTKNDIILEFIKL